MHKIMVALVDANSREEALSKGEVAFNKLIEEGEGGHDWFILFNSDIDKEGHTAGTPRWGKQESPVRLLLKTTNEKDEEIMDTPRNDEDSMKSFDAFTFMGKLIDESKANAVTELDRIRVALNTNTLNEIIESYGAEYSDDDGIMRFDRFHSDKSNTYMRIIEYVDEYETFYPIWGYRARNRRLEDNKKNMKELWMVLADVHW